jgi:hypothetical protein
MSTKTTFKRIALATVAALGFGMLAVTPANAAITYSASFTAPSTVGVLTGYTATTVGTIQLDLASLAGTDGFGANDTATVTMSANDGSLTATDVAFFNALSISDNNATNTASYSTATTGYNLTNNGDVDTTTTTVSISPTSASYATASGKVYVNLAAGLTAAATGGKVKFIMTAMADGRITTLTQYLTLTIGTRLAGTNTVPTSTGTITAGGSATLTYTAPYTTVSADDAWTERTFTLGGTASGQTFSVTAVATGGSITLVRNSSTVIVASAVKSALAGAYSVTYTIVVNAPITATAGQTITAAGFTVTVQPYTPTYSYSTASLAVAANGYYEVTGDAILWGSAATAAGKSADVTILQKDQNAATISQPAYAKTVTATITGKGSLDAVSGADVVVKSKTWSVANGTLTNGTTTVSVYPEGVSGEGTLSISVNGVAVKSYTIRFFGDAATVTATLLRPVGSTAGAVNGVDGSATAVTNNLAAGTTSSVTATTAAAVAVAVKDANGYAIPTASAPIATSSNLTVVSSAARLFTDSGISDAAALKFSAGTFVQHYSYTTVAGSTSGASSDLTFTYVNAAGTALASTAVTVKVGGELAKTVMTLDKATYAPGSVARLTVTGTDAAGNAAYDGIDVIAGGVESTLGFTAPTSMKLKGGTKYADVFAPASPGTWTITAYDAAGREFTATATVTNLAAEAKAAGEAATEAATAAADAAAEATDAANAATDAANAAAEAADAATAAAQDSADAVAALSTQVSEMVAALKKQITALTNLVIKIQKKVKA